MNPSTQAWPPLLEAAPRDTAQSTTRASWVDAARGIAIVCVVFGHVVNGLLGAGVLDAAGAWSSLFPHLQTVQMPVFFFLAGLFVERRLGASGFAKSLVTRIAWPYLLWSAVQISVISALGGWVNTPLPFDGWHYVSLLWSPASQFWFLQTLFLLHLCAMLLLPRGGAKALLVAALFCTQLPRLGPLGVAATAFFSYAWCYALGVLLARGLLARGATPLAGAVAPLSALLLLLVWAVTAQAVVAAWGIKGLEWALPVWIAGAAACIVLAMTPAVAASAVLRDLGRHSMAIFVLHVFFVAGTRIVLMRFGGIGEAWILLPVCVLAGLCGPLLVRAAAARAGIDRALGLA